MTVAGDGAPLRLLVTVTFNENQFLSHFAPIVALPRVGQITVVSDHAGPALPKVRTVVPPRWLTRVLGRAGAKLVVCALLARRERPDWVVSYSLVPHAITGAFVARLARARSMGHLIGGYAEWEGGGWRGGNRVVMAVLRRPSARVERLFLRVLRTYDVLVTMGEETRRRLVALGFDGDRIAVIPPTVATVEEVDGRPASGDRYDIVWMGRLVPVKRLEDLIDSIAALRPRHPELRVGLAGIGPLEGALRERCARLGIERNVDFLGFRHPTALQQGELFVLTSESEGLSIAMLEAMACGLPVVVTDVGELGDVVREGENGYLVEVGDVETLTKRLDALLSDPELRRRLGEAARSDVRSYAAVERATRIYGELLGIPA